jgi:hypothetical protein
MLYPLDLFALWMRRIIIQQISHDRGKDNLLVTKKVSESKNHLKKKGV